MVPSSTIKGLHFVFKQKLFGDEIFFWLPGVYDTPGSHIFLQRIFEELSENLPKFKNILTHWSLAQTGSNYEKNWRSKISLDCLFKDQLGTGPRLVLLFYKTLQYRAGVIGCLNLLQRPVFFFFCHFCCENEAFLKFLLN